MDILLTEGPYSAEAAHKVRETLHCEWIQSSHNCLGRSCAQAVAEGACYNRAVTFDAGVVVHIVAVLPKLKLLAAVTQGITAPSMACHAGTIRGCSIDDTVRQRSQQRKKWLSALNR